MINQTETTTTNGRRIYKARAGQVAYGYPIGMLCAQWNIPFVPGDLNNAGTFEFPMRYLEVPGVSGAAVLRGEGHRFLPLMIEAARQLESEGIRAITGNCGFMAAFQADVADAVNVPVFLTSLVQIPLLTSLIGRGRKLGVLTANSVAVTPAILIAAGVTDSTKLAIKGMQDYPHFNDVILSESGTLDLDLMTREVVAAARDLQEREPSLGGILLECSDLPVYAKAIQDATGLPVFEWAAFIDYVHRAVAVKTFAGIF